MSILSVDITSVGSAGITQASEREILQRMLGDISQALGTGPAATSGTVKGNDSSDAGTWSYSATDASWK